MDSELCCQFAASYECSKLPAVKALERDVLGCDYGGTSWTTREQASNIITTLGLGPDSHLLEIGCGAGWPGLFLSSTTTCRVTLLDMPFNALQHAAARARSDKILERVNLVNGSGTALPFGDGSFDRLSHSDVLCCLPEKREMLEECRRVATADAWMHFSVIQPVAGLSKSDHQRVVESGPPFIDISPPYEDLLSDAGWEITERIDVTAAYADSLSKLVKGLAEHPELQEAYGFEAACDAREHREDQLALARSAKLERLVYVVKALQVPA